MSQLPDLTVAENTSLLEAMNKINMNGMGIVFVVDDGRLVGCATDGDIRRGILEGIETNAPISEVFNESPLTIESSWSDERLNEWISSDEVQSRAPTHGSLAIPVVDGEEIERVVRVKDTGEIVGDVSQPTTSVSTVLVVGGAGYIGSALCRELLDSGYTVRVLDTLIYGDYGIADLRSHEEFTLIEGDMRSIETIINSIKGVDAVIHLGALVGDPASAVDPQKTLEINYHATKLIAEICKYHQINRFIFASTCSVYGRSTRPDELLTEESDLNPVSLYAKSKIESERALLEMRDMNFSPTIFRMATIYGWAPRMRFDLVVNILSAKAYHENVVPIFGGDQYRPHVHVYDAARAYVTCLEAPIEDVDGEIFNVGSNEQDYKIIEVGEIVADCFPDAEIDRQAEKEDERSYQVDFSKISETLDYETEETIASAAREIRDVFKAGKINDYTEDRYSNYRTIEEQFS